MSETKAWTVLDLIQWTAGFLKQKGMDNARREAEDMLGHVLELDRLKLYLEFETVPSPAELSKFRELVARRAKREPLQYLLGWQPFLGMKIRTDARALIPRPETERLVERALEHFKACGSQGRFADIGTGTGCIALGLLKGSEGRGFATDISPLALELAKENAAALGLEERLGFLQGPGLEPLKGQTFDLLVSNPPYIPEAEGVGLQPEVREYEPSMALFAGADGLAVLKGLAMDAQHFLKKGAWLMLECGKGQASMLAGMMEKAVWDEIGVEKDQYGMERFLMARR